MALKSTIFKAELEVTDVERGYYHTHLLTLARHSSETDERMMVRLVAFAFHAHELLAFTEGLDNADVPPLWQKDLTGVIDLWVEIGQPDEKRILKACGKSGQVAIYCYASSYASWWAQTGPKVERARNLSVFALPDATSLGKLAERNMKLHCLIQDGQLWLTSGEDTLQIERIRLR
jgi:uncharacterized protein YaeQ